MCDDMGFTFPHLPTYTPIRVSTPLYICPPSFLTKYIRADIRNFSFSGKGEYLAIVVEEGNHIYLVSITPTKLNCPSIHHHLTLIMYIG
jgi:hypothetical protein